MKPITLVHQHDPDLKLAVALPHGEAGEDAYADWVNDRGRGFDYKADYDLTRVCAIEPKGAKLNALIRSWSGVVLTAAALIVEAVDTEPLRVLDPRELLADSPDDERLDALGLTDVERWLREYPRKGPPGQAQFGIAEFEFGLVAFRAPEPTEWFGVDDFRRRKLTYQMLRSLVASCTLSDVSRVFEYAKEKPSINVKLGHMIRNAAGEEFAVRMGE